MLLSRSGAGWLQHFPRKFRGISPIPLPSAGGGAFFRPQHPTRTVWQTAGSIPYDHEHRNQPQAVPTPRRRHRQRAVSSRPSHQADPSFDGSFKRPQEGLFLTSRSFDPRFPAPQAAGLREERLGGRLPEAHPGAGTSPLNLSFRKAATEITPWLFRNKTLRSGSLGCHQKLGSPGGLHSQSFKTRGLESGPGNMMARSARCRTGFDAMKRRKKKNI